MGCLRDNFSLLVLNVLIDLTDSSMNERPMYVDVDIGWMS